MGYSSFDDSQPTTAKWEPYYTKLPKRVNGKWYWRTWIYRKKIPAPTDPWDYPTYIYGDDFDKLKE